ncbi:PUA-like domain-containing protein [Cladochytrium replicatum]|nr:PUA-like domain-containing protein [Cladochytrium replicatum]
MARFVYKDEVSGHSQVKSSVQRGIRASVLAKYPSLSAYIDDLLPKKTSLILAKCKDHINLVTINSEILFYQHYDGQFQPHLRILHKYPDMLPRLQVDKGAIKFVLSGANIMCPGLTSPGAKLPEADVPEGTIVAIYAEGKEHALAIGITKMSTSDMKSINKGIAVDNLHSLNDGLWKTPTIE